jgi:hypothetical protein
METTKTVKKYSTIIAWGLGLGVGGYFAYKFYKKWKSDQDLAKTQKDLELLATQGVKPTLLSSNYKVLANTIKQACYGLGTDEAAIYGVFNQMKNTADVLSLYSAFGIYEYPCNATEFPIETALGKKVCGSGDLAELLSSELDSKELAKINSILSAKNINYKF